MPKAKRGQVVKTDYLVQSLSPRGMWRTHQPTTKKAIAESEAVQLKLTNPTLDLRVIERKWRVL